MKWLSGYLNRRAKRQHIARLEKSLRDFARAGKAVRKEAESLLRFALPPVPKDQVVELGADVPDPSPDYQGDHLEDDVRKTLQQVSDLFYDTELESWTDLRGESYVSPLHVVSMLRKYWLK